MVPMGSFKEIMIHGRGGFSIAHHSLRHSGFRSLSFVSLEQKECLVQMQASVQALDQAYMNSDCAFESLEGCALPPTQ